MDDANIDNHLSRISTMWTMMFQAHRGSQDAVVQAQQQLLERYCGAVYRYLYAVLRDGNEAEELAQEFALRFLRGGFEGAHPEKGRFRDYLKQSLFNLIREYKKKGKKQQPGADLAEVEPVAPQDSPDDDERFITGWRDELLARTWKALAAYEETSGRILYTVLHYRTQNPNEASAQTAEAFTRKYGKPFAAANIRQLTHRAREKFGDLLVEEISHSLETTEAEEIQQELIDLGLHPYCKDAVKRWLERH